MDLTIIYENKTNQVLQTWQYQKGHKKSPGQGRGFLW
jgi:hypothetical protein